MQTVFRRGRWERERGTTLGPVCAQNKPNKTTHTHTKLGTALELFVSLTSATENWKINSHILSLLP